VKPNEDDPVVLLRNFCRFSDFYLGGPTPRSKLLPKVGARTAPNSILKKAKLRRRKRRDSRWWDSMSEMVSDMQEIYSAGLKKGNGGREGAIATILLVQHILTRLPKFQLDRSDSERLFEPLCALVIALEELNNSATNPLFRVTARRKGRPKASKHSRKLEFIIRCVWAADTLTDLSDIRVNETVYAAAKITAQQFHTGSDYIFSATMIERWRTDHGAEARTRSSENFLFSIPSMFSSNNAEKKQLMRIQANVLLASLAPENIDRPLSVVSQKFMTIGPHNR
jgi:hypothetical protein